MKKMAEKKENYLPINAFYITCLRDKRAFNREYPPTHVFNTRTGELKRVITKTKMDAIDMLIYIVLLSRADPVTYECFPSISKICEDCRGLDRHTVIQHLQDLEHMRFIKSTKNPGRSTSYYMADYAEWVKDPHY